MLIEGKLYTAKIYSFDETIETPNSEALRYIYLKYIRLTKFPFLTYHYWVLSKPSANICLFMSMLCKVLLYDLLSSPHSIVTIFLFDFSRGGKKTKSLLFLKITPGKLKKKTHKIKKIKLFISFQPAAELSRTIYPSLHENSDLEVSSMSGTEWMFQLIRLCSDVK